jgi:co-chaperonin GroES (HSP10)
VAISTPYNPTWKKYEEDIHNEDAQIAIEAGEKFELERKHEVETDPQAKRWEEGRKEAIAKDKPAWAKARQKAEEEKMAGFLKQFKYGGVYMKNLIPVPGYILVKRIKMDSVTESGILLPADVQQRELPTAEVLEVSGDKVYDNGVVEKCPCNKGEKVLHKFGAGLEVTSKQGEVVIMGFADILARFVE